MKTCYNLTLLGAMFLAASCGQSHQSNEQASESEYTLDTTRHNTPADTSAVYNVNTSGTIVKSPPTQYEESNGKQSSRVSIGTDTTGKRPHDFAPGQSRQAAPASGHEAAGHVIEGDKSSPQPVREAH